MLTAEDRRPPPLKKDTYFGKGTHTLLADVRGSIPSPPRRSKNTLKNINAQTLKTYAKIKNTYIHQTYVDGVLYAIGAV